VATNGVVGGVIGGANWQFGSFVLGADADYGWAAGHGNSAVPVTTSVTAVYDYDLQWTSHVRGRVGYDLNGTLLYVAGGVAFAYANVSRAVSLQGAFVTTTFLASDATYTGGSIGAGVERAITNQLTGRVEYLHDDFGNQTYTSATGVLYRVHLTGDTLRGALTWKF
jgi:outer membrane immunogenic protein